MLAKDISRGKMTYPGSHDLPTAWAYLPDLASAFVRVADKSPELPDCLAPFEQFHFRGHSLSGADWAEQLTDIALDQGWLAPDGQLKLGSLPRSLLKYGGLLVPMWRELAEMRYLWQTPHALSGGKLAALIGPESRTELAVAVQQSLEELGKTRRMACAGPVWA